MHNLQPLNAVTIWDSSVPSFVEHLAELFGGYAVYSIMDLFTGYDQCLLHVDSRDMTMFNSPLGLHCLTTLPMGHTNAVQIYQADMAFILQDKIPHHHMLFIDDLPVKSKMSQYQRPDSLYEMILENLGIRLFIWKHLTVIYRILQCLQNINATVLAKKFVLAALDTTIVSHKCTSEGQVPHEAKIQKIMDWPECKNLMQVHGFLGTCSMLRIFIQNFAAIARPLVRLMQKGIPFKWGEVQHATMIHLKDEIIQSLALQHLDYKSGREIVLAVDTSVIAVGFILSQEGQDGKRYPNCFGSISLTSIESRYSQGKLKLYGLFRSLRAVQVFIFGVTNLVVKMDAKYVKGMINNPDLQLNATINRWITSILLFHFEHCHISTHRHTGPDGLSCQPPSDDDPPDMDDFEDWLDNSYSFCVTLLNDWLLPSSTMPCSAHLGFRFPCLPPSIPLASGCFLLLPIPLPIFVQSYSFVLHFSVSEPVTKPNSPTIPWSTKAIAREAWIHLIQGFLKTHARPADLSDTKFHLFINSATKFFLLHGSLWCQELHGHHQLVVPEHRHFGLIKEAHGDLGHKGVFTVQTRLLFHFWWSMLVKDVEWFVQTCHECQIHQTCQLHIPPTMPVIGGLFHKVHLDMMVIPRSGILFKLAVH